jgi:putative endonuclease
MHKQPAAYILASKPNGTLYIGVTSDLLKRAWEHKNDLVEEFTKRYGVHRLVYYELHEDMVSAIRREKQVKKWNRAWKLELIEESKFGLERFVERNRLEADKFPGFPFHGNDGRLEALDGRSTQSY